MLQRLDSNTWTSTADAVNLIPTDGRDLLAVFNALIAEELRERGGIVPVCTMHGVLIRRRHVTALDK